MPELPEVETVRRQLSKYVVGKKVEKITVFKAKSWRGDITQVVGQEIREIQRRSKVLRFVFNKQVSILAHLKMSGQLLFVDGKRRVGGGHPTQDWFGELPSKHTRVQLDFSDGTTLFFNDQRIFGWLRVSTTEEVAAEFAKLAPDIIDPEITTEKLFEIYQRRGVPVKQLLMDNTIAAGVGNIYACDALNLAKISPFRQAKSLSFEEVKRLLKSAKAVIEKGIELGGTTAHGAYVNVKGLSGNYQKVMRVYNRAGQPCPNCDTPIEKKKVAGRGTYYCPNCQI